MENGGELKAEQTQKKGKTPYKDLSKKDKALRIVTFCLAAVVLVCCLSAAFYFLIVGDPDNRITPSFGVAFLAVCPFIIELIFRCRLSSFMLIFVYVFMFFAGFLGCSLNWYNIFGFYDVLIHGIFGYVGAAIGLFVVVKTKNYGGLNVFGAVLTVFIFSLACGAVWEIIEFIADNFMGAHGQGWPINGVYVGGPNEGTIVEGFIDVRDTMEDIIMNTVGAAVFAVHLLVHRLTKKDLLLGTAIQNFASN